MRGKRNNRRGGLPVKLTAKNLLKKNRRKYRKHNAYLIFDRKPRGSGVEPLGTTQVPELNYERIDEEKPLDLMEIWPGKRIEVELEEEELVDGSPSGFLISDNDLGMGRLEREVMEAIVEDDADEARKIILEGANMVPVLVRVLQRDDIDSKWVSWLIGMRVDRDLMLNGSSVLPAGVAGGTRTLTEAVLESRLKKLQRLAEADFNFSLTDAAGDTAFHKLVYAAEEQIQKSVQACFEAGPMMMAGRPVAKRKLAQYQKQEALRRLALMWSELIRFQKAPMDARSLARDRAPELLGYVSPAVFQAKMTAISNR